MMKLAELATFALMLCLVWASPARAQQSKIIMTSNANDLTPDGNTVVGSILDENVYRKIHVFTRGVGHQFRGPFLQSYDGRMQISDNGQYIMLGLYNGSVGTPYWPSAPDPQFGNYVYLRACCVGTVCTVIDSSLCTGRILNSSTCSPTTCQLSPVVGACCDRATLLCTVTSQNDCTGSGKYWIGDLSTCGNYPCSHGHVLPFRYSAATNQWTNLGSLPNVSGLGASKCDGSIATPYGFSGDGRFVAGSTNYGAFASTACNTRGVVIDAATGTAKMLPMVGGGCQPFSQGEFISDNGLVALGSDSHVSPDNLICNARCVTVWERATATGEFLASGRTVLDRWGAGGLSAAVMTPDGTTIVTSMSEGEADATGLDSRGLYMHIKNTATGAWDRMSIGRCADRQLPLKCMKPGAISADGDTVVGIAVYGDTCSTFFALPRPFIWRPTINEGVPMDFEDYLASINGGPFTSFSPGQSISADGNAILGSVASLPNNCTNNGGLTGLGGSAILYLNGSSIPCEPPRIVGGPYNKIQEEYTIFGIVENVFASGSYPLYFQWQKESPAGSNIWVNIGDSCGTFSPDNTWVYEGTTGAQLRINMLSSAQDRDGSYRVVVTNSCGTATSPVANVGVRAGACCYSVGGSVQCTVELPTRCTGSTVISYFLGGVYLGDNTTCSPDPCGAVTGACCFGAGGANATCVMDVSSNCTRVVDDGGRGGSYAGDGTTCTPGACAAVSGACCYSINNTSNASCTTEVGAYCSAATSRGGLAGAFLGNGVVCGPTACAGVAGACCYAPDSASGVICTIQTETRCTNLPQNAAVPGYINGLQGIYVGNGTTCLPVNQQCGFVAGACCYSLDDTSSAICTVQLQDRCTRAKNNSGLGGNYRGDGTTCTASSCTSVTGACCYTTFNDPGVILCTIQPANRCTARFNAGGLFGTYLGGGTACTPTACSASVGACCYTPQGSTCTVCSVQPGSAGASLRCTDPVNGGLGGVFSGLNTTCASAGACSTDSGACCLGTFCFSTCQTDCVNNQGGTFQGLASTCSPVDPCQPVTTGACCSGSTCSVTTQGACVGSGTMFAGLNTACNAAGNTTSPCCKADYNHAGGVSVQDIFDFLNGYFASSPQADFNGGGVSVQDIFDFLGAYFAGCN